MVQTYTADVYDSTKVVATTMQNVENNFAALKSGFSGTAAPANVVGGQVWHDSTARKVRNYANSAWLASLMGGANFKIWVYRNDTDEGWLIDDTVVDRVIALKGGTRAFNVNGGNVGGSWTVGGLTTNHTHTYSGTTDGAGNLSSPFAGTQGSGTGLSHDHGYSGTTSEGSVAAASSDATWRPAAAVGTLQYPDLS